MSGSTPPPMPPLPPASADPPAPGPPSVTSAQENSPQQGSPQQGVPQQGVQPTPRFSCRTCGSELYYAPGTTVLRCSACGGEQPIIDDGRQIAEHAYDQWARAAPAPVAGIGQQVLRCQNCGATTETDLLATRCQFCSGVLIALQNPPGLVAPEAVLPFLIEKSAANEAFGAWVRSRWFAPTALKKVGSTEAITGTYVPHWTYDATTDTAYAGQRGEHYWVTVMQTVSDGQGGTRQQAVQEMRTRWWPASGTVHRAFDDVLVAASHATSIRRLEQAGPWDLTRATAYRPEFVAGYSALRYDVDPDTGLQDARSRMESVIENDCRADIGGDEQVVSNMDVRYSAIMFKLVLLPLWIATYLHAGKTFQVLVNAKTGQVVGDRPISKVKVALAVVAALIVIGVLAALYLANRSPSGGARGQ